MTHVGIRSYKTVDASVPNPLVSGVLFRYYDFSGTPGGSKNGRGEENSPLASLPHPASSPVRQEETVECEGAASQTVKLSLTESDEYETALDQSIRTQVGQG